MRPSARLRKNTVTVRVFPWTNAKGVRTRGAPVETTWRASVQPAVTNRLDDHLREAGEITHTVLFAGDPGVKPGDLILWGSRTLVCAGPAADQAGRGVAWVVAAREET